MIMELWIIQGVNFGLMGLLGLPPSSQTWVAGKSIIESDALPGKQPMCEGFLVAMFDYWRVLTIQRDVFDFGMKKIGESLESISQTKECQLFAHCSIRIAEHVQNWQ